MLTPSLAEPAAILTIPLIYPQYNSLIHLSNIAMHFHNSYLTVTSLSIIYIPAYSSHSPLPQTHLRQNLENLIFQPVLQAYPTRHSWIITAHVSLGNLECHLKLFSRQLTRTQQFLRSSDQHPSAPTQLLTMLQLELSNIQDMYKSSDTTISSAINLLNSNQLKTST